MIIKFILGNSSASAIRLLSFVILISAFGPEKYSLIAFCLSISIVATNFSLLGSYNNSIRRVLDKKDKTLILYLSIVPSIIISVCFVLLGRFIFDSEDEYMVFILIYTSELFSTVFLSLISALLVSLQSPLKSTVCKFLVSIGSLSASLYAYFLEADVIEWAICNAIISSLTIYLPFYFFWKLGATTDRSAFTLKLLFKNIKVEGWVTLSVLSRNLFLQVDKLVLSYLLPPIYFGLYSIAMRLVSSIYLLISNFISFHEAHFYKAGAKSLKSVYDYGESIFCQIRSKILIVVFLCISISVSIYLLSDAIGLFGNDFKEGIIFFTILIISLYPMTKFWVSLYVLNGASLEKDRSILLFLLSGLGGIIMGLSALAGGVGGAVGLVVNYFIASVILNQYIIIKANNVT